MVTVVLPLGSHLSLSCQKITRRDNLDADLVPLRQHELVTGHRRRLGRCAQRREFSIVGISDHDEIGGVDRPGKLLLESKEVGDLLPIEARDPAQDHLGLRPGRVVPDQPVAPFADALEDARGGASRVEERRYEYVGIDHDAFHEPSASAILLWETPVNSQKGESGLAIDYEKRDGVAYITLNSPEKANILDKPTSDAISAAWIDLWEDRDVRCAILTGAGDRHFCGGHNLAPRPNITDEEREYLRTQRIFWPLAGTVHGQKTGVDGRMGDHYPRVWKPVIAAVNGWA